MSERDVKLLMDYVVIKDRIGRCVQDAMVVRGKMVDSDHHLVVGKNESGSRMGKQDG